MLVTKIYKKLLNTLFPEEITDMVVDYTPEMKWRNGKYIQQIPKSLSIYQILLKIPITKHKSVLTNYSGPYSDYDERIDVSIVEFQPVKISQNTSQKTKIIYNISRHTISCEEVYYTILKVWKKKGNRVGFVEYKHIH
jgi:hypothetical protein